MELNRDVPLNSTQSPAVLRYATTPRRNSWTSPRPLTVCDPSIDISTSSFGNYLTNHNSFSCSSIQCIFLSAAKLVSTRFDDTTKSVAICKWGLKCFPRVYLDSYSPYVIVLHDPWTIVVIYFHLRNFCIKIGLF